MPTSSAPPIFTQLPVLSTRTKPRPKAAQALAFPAPLSGNTLPVWGDRSEVGNRAVSAEADEIARQPMAIMERVRMQPCSAATVRFPSGAEGQKNLIPAELPRRQTTWQLRPVRASRAKASWMTPGS
jgi:hypothetical protein